MCVYSSLRAERVMPETKAKLLEGLTVLGRNIVRIVIQVTMAIRPARIVQGN